MSIDREARLNPEALAGLRLERAETIATAGGLEQALQFCKPIWERT